MTPLIVIAGPTGSGKSEASLAVCAAIGGEVVNCDSLQIYRHFNIGTAKLPAGSRAGIPHHLIDIADPDQLFTAGEYGRLARRELAAIGARGCVPVVVGGTGLYLRALLEGLFAGPSRDTGLRARLAARRPGSLHRLLSRFDPAAARRIHANDTPKLMRALEVRLLTRRPLSGLFAEGRAALEGFRILKLGLSPPREALYERLDRRAAAMFEGGLIEETRATLALGFPASSKPFESHGYRQVIQFLNGELSAKEALFYMQRNTRHYAKRQVTWFRQEKGMEWFQGFGGDPAVQQAMLARVREFLN